MAGTAYDQLTVEQGLLTLVAKEGRFRELIDLGVDESYFQTAPGVSTFELLKYHYLRKEAQGETLSLGLVRMRNHSFRPVDLPDDLKSLVFTLKTNKYKRTLDQLVDDLRKVVDGPNPFIAEDILKRTLPKLQEGSQEEKDCVLSDTDSCVAVMNNYYQVQDRTGATVGVPYPWDTLNKETLGMTAGQMIVFYGRPKSMKSFLANKVVTDAYTRHRRRVLYFTAEMTKEETRERTVAIAAGVPFQDLRKGKLSPNDENRFLEALMNFREDEMQIEDCKNGKKLPYFIICPMERESGILPLQAKIDRYEPDIVVVDGAYLLADSRKDPWKAMVPISRGIKTIAQRYNLPVIATTQANREGEKTKGDDLTELAFSDSFGQDADLLFRIIRCSNMPVLVNGRVDRYRTELIIRAPGSRNVMLDNLVVAFEPCIDFSEIGVVSKKELKERIKISEEQENERISGRDAPPMGEEFEKEYSPKRMSEKESRTLNQKLDKLTKRMVKKLL